MSTWFRMYAEVLNDPKAQRLPGETFKGWVNVLCIAAQNDGALPSDEDIAFALRIDARKAVKLMNDLRDAGLIDVSETGRKPHNWNGRQYKSDVSTDRVKRFRERSTKRFKNGDETSGETAPDTDTETDVSLANANDAKSDFETQPDPDPEKAFWDMAKGYLGKSRASMIGKWVRDHGREETGKAITAAQIARAVDPVPYIERCFREARREPEFSSPC